MLGLPSMLLMIFGVKVQLTCKAQIWLWKQNWGHEYNWNFRVSFQILLTLPCTCAKCEAPLHIHNLLTSKRPPGKTLCFLQIFIIHSKECSRLLPWFRVISWKPFSVKNHVSTTGVNFLLIDTVDEPIIYLVPCLPFPHIAPIMATIQRSLMGHHAWQVILCQPEHIGRKFHKWWWNLKYLFNKVHSEGTCQKCFSE